MKIIHLLLGSLLILAACKKDNYLVNEGGTDRERIRKMSSYDFLKESRVLDTVVMLIDRAGMKEEINGDLSLIHI